MKIELFNRLQGCIISGAIGDSFGSCYENFAIDEIDRNSIKYDPANSYFTDDTQLTLATCESIVDSGGRPLPEGIAQKIVEWYKNRRITGIGSSTLKAVNDLMAGVHWALAGRKGEYGAGNGAAIRIAPVAFFMHGELDRDLIRDISRITHHNDEAYIGALCIVLAIRKIIRDNTANHLIPYVIKNIPDTRVKDRLLELQHHSDNSIFEIGKEYGASGYVVESVPLSLFAAQKSEGTGMEKMLQELISVGGDTDSNCSMAGQLAGTLIGYNKIPDSLKEKVSAIPDYDIMINIIDELKQFFK